jgi:hypothetical protein
MLSGGVRLASIAKRDLAKAALRYAEAQIGPEPESHAVPIDLPLAQAKR